MPTTRHWTWRTKAACAGAGVTAVLIALSGTALAAQGPHGLPKAGKQLLYNGDFASPKLTSKNEGITPTGWKLVLLGVEKKPYSAAIGLYNAKGTYPPPKGNPNKSDIADEAFYEAGTSTGVEGIGGQQTSAKFGSITQANNPQVSFSDVEHSAPEAGNSAWAGTGLQFTFTSGKKSYTLTYFNQWTAYKSTYKKKPVNTKTAKYVLGKTLKADAWYTWKAFSLNSGIQKAFGLKTYKLTAVTFANIEDTINSAKPYANMDGYFTDLSITEGKA
jgi:hypothetical protein